ncbi:hypothetical protein [Nostoc sp. MS1]|uniref:hypothetical protein n=1 Tax=Nostoc sp. MS1 TaxID=2764711 RepID=UPI001CC5FAF7|nr:hypothetical protein [Nostoc sp. MS1]BCL34147.1 hypothetical protein NSMS1_05940 [Nostoc sp. MS1]
MNNTDKCFYIWFRILRNTYPWLSLFRQARRVILSCGDEKVRQKLRFWWLFYQVDFAKILAIALELAQPEFWV